MQFIREKGSANVVGQGGVDIYVKATDRVEYKITKTAKRTYEVQVDSSDGVAVITDIEDGDRVWISAIGGRAAWSYDPADLTGPLDDPDDITIEELKSSISNGGSDGTLSPPINDKDSATNTTNDINTALQNNRVVTVKGSGVVYIDGTIVVPSNTSFITEGVTLTAKDGETAFRLISNEALTNAYVKATVTAIDGSTATVTSTSHGFDRQTSFVMQNTGVPLLDFVYRVDEIIDANTFTIQLIKTGIPLPVGDVDIKVNDKHIYINAEVDYNSENMVDAGGYDAHAVVLSGITDSNIKIRTFNSAKYGGQISANIGCDVDIEAYSLSDMFKVYGPSKDLVVKARGQASDDCVTIQCKEPEQFIAYQPTIGNCVGVTVQNSSCIQNTEHAHTACYVIYTDDEYWNDGINFTNASASSRNNALFTIRPGNTFDATNQAVGSVIVDGLKGKSVIPVRVASSVKSLTINNPTVTVNSQGTRWFEHTGGNISTLTISNLVFNTDFHISTSEYFIKLRSDINTVLFTNCTIEGTAAADSLKFVQLLEGTFGSIKFLGGSYKQIETIIRTEPAATVGSISVDSCVIEDLDYIFNVTSSTKCLIANTTPVNVSRIMLGGGNGEFELQTLNAPAPSNGVFRTFFTAFFTPMSDNINWDLNDSTTIPKVGGKCITTAAAGTIPSGSFVICDGTTWYNTLNPSQTYT